MDIPAVIVSLYTVYKRIYIGKALFQVPMLVLPCISAVSFSEYHVILLKVSEGHAHLLKPETQLKCLFYCPVKHIKGKREFAVYIVYHVLLSVSNSTTTISVPAMYFLGSDMYCIDTIFG